MVSALLLASRARVNRLGAGSGWNPSDKGSNIVLSSTKNCIATNSAASWQSLRSVTSHSSGKFYFEIQSTADGAAHNLTIGGVGDSTFSLSDFMGSGTGNLARIIFGTAASAVQGTFTISNAMAAIPAGFAVLFALDFTTKKVYTYNTNTNQWTINSPGGGAQWATWTGTPTLFAGASVFGTAGQVVLNTGFAPWASVSAVAACVSAGYSPWG